jgi:hypothetical protein
LIVNRWADEDVLSCHIFLHTLLIFLVGIDFKATNRSYSQIFFF